MWAGTTGSAEKGQKRYQKQGSPFWPGSLTFCPWNWEFLVPRPLERTSTPCSSSSGSTLDGITPPISGSPACRQPILGFLCLHNHIPIPTINFVWSQSISYWFCFSVETQFCTNPMWAINECRTEPHHSIMASAGISVRCCHNPQFNHK